MKCRMCDAEYYIKTRKITRNLLMPLTEAQALMDAATDALGITYQRIAVRFCPFCGKNLGDEEDENK